MLNWVKKQNREFEWVIGELIAVVIGAGVGFEYLAAAGIVVVFLTFLLIDIKFELSVLTDKVPGNEQEEDKS